MSIAFGHMNDSYIAARFSDDNDTFRLGELRRGFNEGAQGLFC
jgi:hypothetical protein